MARRIATHYVVRRPLTLWGEPRKAGDIITREEAKSIVRIESLVRAGRLDEKFDEVPVEEPKPAKKVAKKAAPKLIIKHDEPAEDVESE